MARVTAFLEKQLFMEGSDVKKIPEGSGRAGRGQARERNVSLWRAQQLLQKNFGTQTALDSARRSGARLVSRFWGLDLTQVSTKENINMATLSYSVTEPALRSPVEEWQPHGKQSETTKEWWYLTAVVHDTAGNPYFLVWCPFHFTGEKSSPASAGLPRNQRAIAALVGFTDYRDDFRIDHFPAAVVNEAETWNPKTHAVHQMRPYP